MGVEALVFDSFGTLFDPRPLGRRFDRLGLGKDALRLFLARLTRDAIALDAAGRPAPFATIAEGAVEAMCVESGVVASDRDISDVIDGIKQLPPFADAADALAHARQLRLRTAVLTNGSLSTTDLLLERAGLRPLIDHVLSAEAIGRPKPRPEAYRAALDRLGLPAARVGFLSAHAWDVQGARALGCVTVWINRLERRFQRAFGEPHLATADLDHAVLGLGRLGGGAQAEPLGG